MIRVFNVIELSRINNIVLRHHVQYGFALIMLLIVISASTVLHLTHQNNKIVTDLVQFSNAKVEHVISMREAIRLRVNSVSIMLSTDDPFERDEEIMRFYGYAAQFVDARKKLLALPMNAAEKRLLEDIRKAIKIVQPYTTNIVEKARVFTPGEQLMLTAKIAHKKREKLFGALNQLVQLQQNYAQDALLKTHQINTKTDSITILVTVMVLIISMFIASFVSRTVSRQKKQLMQAYEDAQAATRSKSIFLANMSHEIRTPITAMIGFAESTFFSDQTMEMRQKSIKTIIESGKHLLHIVNDVLDISKIEANRLEVENIPVNIFDVISGAETILRPLAQSRLLDFDISYSFPLPVEIKTDSVRLKQIIINLASNAIKFTDTGYVNINVHYSDSEGKLKIDVEDTGIGLNEAQIIDIFEPFKQADSSINRKYGGTGLGLTLSLQLVQALGGDIEVTSKPGAGSCFSIILNIGQIEENNLTIRKANSVDNDQYTNDIKSIDEINVTGNVLAAEDNIVNQQLLTVFLNRMGVNYKIVENGKLAVHEAQTGEYDLILMDIQMPEMDGITATRILRGQGFSKPIIALTANSSQEDRKDCFDAGCTNFLTKPIDIKNFFQTISGYLNGTTIEDQHVEPIYSAFSLHDPDMAALVEGFVNIHLPVMLRDIERAINEKDWEMLKQKLHELNGTSGNVGYLALLDITRQMEFQVLNENQKELVRLIRKLTNISERISAGINTSLENQMRDSNGAS